MSGEDSTNVERKALANSIEDAEWSFLEPHLKRDALIVVERDLTLFEAGVRIAEDQKAQVAEWIKQGRLRKPSAGEVDTWSKSPSTPFRCLVVQPYVLIQAVLLQ